MKQWLADLLACPRDRQPFRWEETRLTCAAGHAYPMFDGVPVLVLGEVDQPHWAASRALRIASGVDEVEEFREEAQGVHPFVKRAVGATSGLLYVPIAETLNRYPIPELRLPEGGGRTLLDIGCNWGRWSVAAARKGYRTIGLDPSLDAVLVARSVCRQLGVEAEFVVGDARFLPLLPGSLDTVFSFGVLQHLPKEDVRKSLASIRETLKPGGRALVQMAGALGIRSLYQQARRGFRRPRAFEVRYWTPHELLRAFETLLGPSTLSVDCFFGLGIQAADLDLMPRRFRAVIRASEMVRNLANAIPAVTNAADSLYVSSHRPLPGEEVATRTQILLR